MPLENIAILVQDLTKQYKKTNSAALKGLSFHVRQGEIFGYLGPNGAGKTTTIRIMAGLSQPTEGLCQIFGKNTVDYSGLHNDLGVVFEESNLYERLSGLENLRFFARLHGVPLDRAKDLLYQYGLEGAAKKPIGTYSKGMKRRLLICRALLHDPRVLIMDEPTSGLDPTSAGVIHNAILQYRKQGKTVFLSTHDMAEADSLCHRVAFINQGEIAALDEPQILKRRFGKPALVVEFSPDSKDPHAAAALEKHAADAGFTLKQETGEVHKIHIPLDRQELGAKLDWLSHRGQILTIHSQEASLGQVFQNVTGAHLQDKSPHIMDP